MPEGICVTADHEMTWEVTDVLLDEGIYLVTLGKRLA